MLRAHLPIGPAWLAWRTPGKFAYRLMAAIGTAFDAMTAFFCRIEQETDPYRTVELLSEWQAAASLPDACFPAEADYERQIKYLVFRLTKKRWVTIQDMHDLAAFFGLEITVTPGRVIEIEKGYPYCYPLQYTSEIVRAGGRFRLYVDLDSCREAGYAYEYPIRYQAPSIDCEAFLCLLRRITPANVLLIINRTPARCEA